MLCAQKKIYPHTNKGYAHRKSNIRTEKRLCAQKTYYPHTNKGYAHRNVLSAPNNGRCREKKEASVQKKGLREQKKIYSYMNF